jgi:hypothetical protein
LRFQTDNALRADNGIVHCGGWQVEAVSGFEGELLTQFG